MPPRPFFALLIALVAGLLSAGCTGTGSDETPRSSPKSQSTEAAPSGSAEEVVETEKQVDIGGRSLHLKCWGERISGQPSVLLVSGQGPPLTYWEVMAADFATEDRHLCAYDRAGVGQSAAAPEAQRTMVDQVADLLSLLDAIELEEPLVVVAHSLGSLPAIGLVDRAPDRVAAVVFLDPTSPRMSATLIPALPAKKANESAALVDERRFLTEFLADPTQNPERLLIAKSEGEAAQVLDKPGRLFGDRPVVVLQAPPPPPVSGLSREYNATNLAAILDGNKELAAESTRGRVFEVEDTGHDIHVDQPEVVMNAIRDVTEG